MQQIFSEYYNLFILTIRMLTLQVSDVQTWFFFLFLTFFFFFLLFLFLIFTSFLIFLYSYITI